jgi:phosphatidylglycerol:prolipoprotein diacylglycerol transferase
MYNDLFSIGPLTIHGYGVMTAIGVLVAFWAAGVRAKKYNLSSDTLLSLGIAAVIIGYVCAKLLYCIVELKEFLANPWSILSGSGFVVYGGLIGGIAAAIVYSKIKKVSFLAYFDLAAPSISVAQGFGRIGCFLAGCCYGKPTDSWIGIAFTRSDIAPNGVKLIPTQLISSAGNFLFAALLFLYARKERRRGKVGALYMLLYSVGRFIIEFFRNDDRGFIGFLSTSQFIAIFIFIAGLALFFCDKLPKLGEKYKL